LPDRGWIVQLGDQLPFSVSVEHPYRFGGVITGSRPKVELTAIREI